MSAPIAIGQQPLTVLPPELHPSVDHLITEDDTPVDGIYSEKQMRLLTEPLYCSWPGPGDNQPFVAMANVGMFYALREPPLVPDCLLSLKVRFPDDLHQKKHRSYFFWEYGKPPEVVIEVVSNKEGEELGKKLLLYSQNGIPIYVVWDPLNEISDQPLRIYFLRRKSYELVDDSWFPEVGLGLKVWHGEFEKMQADWLRWCDEQGQLIATGKEAAEAASQRAEKESHRAEKESQRAERLAAQLLKLGVEPETGDA